MNLLLRFLGFFPLIMLAMGASNCTQHIKYESDKGMLAPYQAEVFEFPVDINGSVCKDMSDQVGACTKIISERQDLNFGIASLPYNYNIVMKCSSQVNFSHNQDIQLNQPHRVVISKELYQGAAEFICIGRITPSDRSFVSSRFEVRVRVQDGQFVKRENGYIYTEKNKSYLVMGKNALYTYVFDNGFWKTHEKAPVIQVYDLANLKAFSESEIMRLNFYKY